MEQGRYDGRSRNAEVFTLQTLPLDIILEIVGRVASKSVLDVFNFRLSCKSFNLFGKHKYVLERMAIGKLDKSGISLLATSRNDSHARSFLTDCINAGNPDALLIQGLVKVFTECDHEAGIEVLRKESDLGYDVASYACAIVMYCWGSEEAKCKGFALLNCVKRKLGYKIINCRKRVATLFENVVVTKRPPFNWKWNTCTNITLARSRRSCQRSCPWKAMKLLVEDKEDGLACEMCTCNIECRLFQSIIQWSARFLLDD